MFGRFFSLNVGTSAARPFFALGSGRLRKSGNGAIKEGGYADGPQQT